MFVLTTPGPPSLKQIGPARGKGNALEVFLAHGPVAAVPVEALYALGGSLLAWVEPLALALARRR